MPFTQREGHDLNTTAADEITTNLPLILSYDQLGPCYLFYQTSTLFDYYKLVRYLRRVWLDSNSSLAPGLAAVGYPKVKGYAVVGLMLL